MYTQKRPVYAQKRPIYVYTRPRYVPKRPMKETCKKTLSKRPQEGGLSENPTDTYVYTQETYVDTQWL